MMKKIFRRRSQSAQPAITSSNPDEIDDHTTNDTVVTAEKETYGDSDEKLSDIMSKNGTLRVTKFALPNRKRSLYKIKASALVDATEKHSDIETTDRAIETVTDAPKPATENDTDTAQGQLEIQPDSSVKKEKKKGLVKMTSFLKRKPKSRSPTHDGESLHVTDEEQTSSPHSIDMALGSVIPLELDPKSFAGPDTLGEVNKTLQDHNNPELVVENQRLQEENERIVSRLMEFEARNEDLETELNLHVEKLLKIQTETSDLRLEKQKLEMEKQELTRRLHLASPISGSMALDIDQTPDKSSSRNNSVGRQSTIDSVKKELLATKWERDNLSKLKDDLESENKAIKQALQQMQTKHTRETEELRKTIASLEDIKSELSAEIQELIAQGPAINISGEVLGNTIQSNRSSQNLRGPEKTSMLSNLDVITKQNAEYYHMINEIHQLIDSVPNDKDAEAVIPVDISDQLNDAGTPLDSESFKSRHEALKAQLSDLLPIAAERDNLKLAYQTLQEQVKHIQEQMNLSTEQHVKEVQLLHEEKQNVAHDLRKANEDMADLTGQVDKFKQDLQASAALNASLESDKVRLQQELEQKRHELATFIKELEDTRMGFNATLESKIAEKDCIIQAHGYELNQLELKLRAEIQDFQDQLSSMISLKNNIELENSTLKETVDKLEINLKALYSSRDALQSQCDEQLSQIDTLKRATEALEESCGELKLTIAALDTEKKSLETQLEHHKQSNQKHWVEIESLQSDKKTLLLHLDDIQDQLKSQTSQVLRLQQEVDILRNDGTTATQSLQEEVNRLKGECSQLEVVLAESKANNKEALTYAAKLEISLSEVNEQFNKKQQQVYSLENELVQKNDALKLIESRHQDDVKQLQDVISELHSDIDKIQHELTTETDQRKLAEELHSVTVTQLQEIKVQLEEMTSLHDTEKRDLINKNDQLDSQIQLLQSELTSFRSLYDAKTQELDTALKTSADVDLRLQESLTLIANLKIELDALSAKARDESDQLTSQIKTLESQYHALNLERDTLSSQIQALESSVKYELEKSSELERVNENLNSEKVKLTSEIESLKVSLDAEVSRAACFEESTKAKDIEKERIMSDLESATRILKDQAEKLNCLETLNLNISAERESLVSNVALLAESLKDESEKTKTLMERNDILTATKAQLESDIVNLEQEVQSLKDGKAAVEALLDEQHGRNSVIESSKSEIEKDHRALKEQLIVSNQANGRLHTRIRELESLSDRLHGQIQIISEEITQKNNIIQRLELEIKKLEADLTIVQGERDSLSEDNKAHTETHHRLEFDLEQERHALKCISDQLKREKDHILQLNESITAFEMQIKSFEQELCTSKEQHVAAVDLNAQLGATVQEQENTINDLKSKQILLHEDIDKITGDLHQSQMNFIRAQESIKTLESSVLNLQDIIAERTRDIQRLVDEIQNATNLQAETDNQLRSNQTLLSQSQSRCQELVSDLEAQNTRFIRLEEEFALFRLSADKDQGSIIASYEVKKRQYEDDIREMTEKLEKTQMQLDGKDSELKEHIKQIEDLQNMARHLQEGLSLTENARNDIVAGLTSEHESLIAKIQSLKSIHESQETALLESRKKIEELFQRISQMEAENAVKQTEFQAVVDHASESQSMSEQIIANLESKQSELLGEIERLTSQLDALRLNSEKNHTQFDQQTADLVQKHQNQIEEREKEIKAKNDEIQDLIRALNSATDKLDVSLTQIDQLQKHLREYSDKYDRMEPEMETLRLEVAALTDELNEMKTAESDFKRELHEKERDLTRLQQQTMFLQKIITETVQRLQSAEHIDQHDRSLYELIDVLQARVNNIIQRAKNAEALVTEKNAIIMELENDKFRLENDIAKEQNHRSTLERKVLESTSLLAIHSQSQKNRLRVDTGNSHADSSTHLESATTAVFETPVAATQFVTKVSTPAYDWDLMSESAPTLISVKNDILYVLCNKSNTPASTKEIILRRGDFHYLHLLYFLFSLSLSVIFLPLTTFMNLNIDLTIPWKLSIQLFALFVSVIYLARHVLTSRASLSSLT